MTSGREGSGMVSERDKPQWWSVCPCWDPWEGGWIRALHPSRNSESMCLDRSPHDGWGECPSDGDSSPELRDMWKYGCPKSPVWSSGGDECAGSEGTSSFEDYEHNVDNLALEAFPSTRTGCDFWGEGCVGRNGVRVNSVNELACLILRFLLQFEHGVCPFFRMTVFLLFVCVPPYFVWSSGGRKEALQPFGSFVAKIGRMVETPKLFMVRAFHLLVSLTGTGDGCFLLEPRSFDSKSLWKSTDGVVTTKWWSVGVMDEHGWRNGGYFAHGAAQKDVQKTVVVPQIKYIAVCDATTSSPNLECSETVEVLQNAINRKGGQWPCQEKESSSLNSHVLWLFKKGTNFYTFFFSEIFLFAIFVGKNLVLLS